MNKTLASVLLATAFGLSACGPANKGVESVHQPVVQRADYVLDVATSPEGIGSGEAQRISEWFASLRLRYGDRVSVDNPDTYSGSNAAQSVAAVAAGYGLLVSEGAPVTSGEIPAGFVRVVVSRVQASVPGCPNWSRPAQPEYEGSALSNYGCAMNANIAAMMANPQDLLEGRQATGGASVTNGSKAIKAFKDSTLSGNGGQTIKSEGVGK